MSTLSLRSLERGHQRGLVEGRLSPICDTSHRRLDIEAQIVYCHVYTAALPVHFWFFYFVLLLNFNKHP
jgi:hypothetical protein